MSKQFKWLWLAVVVIVLDQWTKHFFVATMQLGESIPVLPFFNWTLAHNYGAAFSFLHDAGGWQRWFFGVIAVVVSIGIMVWLWRLPAQGARFLAIGLALILGGAMGNLYDRLMHGYVVDFIHLHYAGWNFPAFNIADCGITVGAIMLVIDAFFFEQQRERAKAQVASDGAADA